MTDLRQAAQQALEALGSGNPYHQQLAAKVLRTALEQQAEPTCPDCKAAVLYECVACSSNNYPPKQQAEPVTREGFNVWWDGDYDDSENRFEKDSAAYWAWAGWQAAQRPWVGLTDDEMSDTVADIDVDFGDLLWKVVCLTKIIEAQLKERNGY